MVAADELEAPAAAINIKRAQSIDKHQSVAHQDVGLCAQEPDGRGQPT